MYEHDTAQILNNINAFSLKLRTRMYKMKRKYLYLSVQQPIRMKLQKTLFALVCIIWMASVTAVSDVNYEGKLRSFAGLCTFSTYFIIQIFIFWLLWMGRIFPSGFSFHLLLSVFFSLLIYFDKVTLVKSSVVFKLELSSLGPF